MAENRRGEGPGDEVGSVWTEIEQESQLFKFALLANNISKINNKNMENSEHKK